MADILIGPNKFQLEAIKEDLREDEDRLNNNVKHLEKWIESQSHLPQNYDKNSLQIFLRGCKHDMVKAKRKFEFYYSIKDHLDALFIRDPRSNEIYNFTKNVNIAVIPELTPEGRRVIVYKLLNSDSSRLSMKQAISFFQMIYEIRFSEDHAYASEIHVFDANGFTMAHVPKFVSPVLKKYCFLLRKAYPFRITQVHIINAPPFITSLLQLVKPLIHNNVRNRFIIHKGTETLKDYIPEDIVPVDMGGSNSVTTQEITDRWYKVLVNHSEWFKNQSNVKAKGPISKNIHQSCGFEDSYGAEGSFRQLEID